jgi:hypothetical protein
MKKYIISILVLLLFLSTTCIPVSASGEMPDLIIEDLLIFPGDFPDEEEFDVQIKNIGNASTPNDKNLDVSISVRWKIFGLLPLISVRKFTCGTGGFNLAPNESIILPFATTYRMPLLGFYTFYCKVNPKHIIDESNYQNNMYTETVLLILQRSLTIGYNQYECIKME